MGQKAHRFFGLRELLDIGINVAGGTDSPIVPNNWLHGVQASVTRKSATTGRVFAPELAINVEDGIRLFTINAAYQENMEDVRGSIEISKVADFQVLGKDILAAEPERISEIPVQMTIVGGRVVYEA